MSQRLAKRRPSAARECGERAPRANQCHSAWRSVDRAQRGSAVSPREYDESDVRVRPGRSSRPRSKRRPGHADAEPAMVTTVDRGRWTCAPDGDATRDPVVAMRARELGRTPIVVGDRVGLVGDLSGKPDTLARIVRVEERTTVLRRTADDTDPVERLVVANAEQLVIVTAV